MFLLFILSASFSYLKMDDVQELQVHIRGSQQPPVPPKDAIATHEATPPSPASQLRHWKWWFMVVLMSFFVLAGQTAATLLGRFYYNEGGNSKWMATIVQSAGSALLLLPLLLFPSSNSPTISILHYQTAKIVFIWISMGLIMAGNNLMYSYGLLYLPVSTYSLICATQLAFNAVFSYFLNAEKFTALIFNSVVLLTFSAALLGIRAGSETSSGVSGGKYVLGFMLTLAASACFSLVLSLMQFTFEKVLKRVNFRVVLEIQTQANFIAACASVVGLFASGDWRSLKGEMQSFRKGSGSYMMTLVWTAISWQFTSVGTVGLIFITSSLFSNMIGTMALPLIPVFAVIWFHDKMDGLKLMAMLLAFWGFLSYIYQHYLDDCKARKMVRADVIEISVASDS